MVDGADGEPGGSRAFGVSDIVHATVGFRAEKRRRRCMVITHRRSVLTLVLAILLPFAVLVPHQSTVQAATLSVAGLHVVGNQIENGNDQAVQLLGANRAGSEYACIEGWGIFDGP